MAHLQLNLISGSSAGQSDACRFTSLGGTVGRSSECDWTLHDSDRYISNKHILITFQNNQFVLTDVSSNGVFINQSAVPLGKPNTHVLQIDDKINLGKFCLSVIELVIDDEISVTPAYVSDVPRQASESGDLLGLVTGSNTSDKSTSVGDSPIGGSDSPLPGDNLGLFDILSGDTNTQSEPQFEYKVSQKPAIFFPETSPTPVSSDDASQGPTSNATQGNSLAFGDANKIPEDWDINGPAVDDFEPVGGLSDDPANTLADLSSDEQRSASRFAVQPSFLNSNSDKARSEALTPNSDVNTAPLSAHEEASPIAASVPLGQASSPRPTPSDAGEITNSQNAAPTLNIAPTQTASHKPSAVPAAATVLDPSSQDDFFKLIYEKLGLPKEYVASVDKTQFAEDLVNILMTSTQGIMSLLAGRSVFKQESRLSMTMIKPQSNNPIKFSLDPSDTLEMLLVKKKPGYKTAQDSYAEALNDIQLHQMAFLSGLQATLNGVLGELNPQDIEKMVDEKSSRFIGLKANSKRWEAFKTKQDDLSKQVNENLNDILSKHFSDAYEAQINSIKSS